MVLVGDYHYLLHLAYSDYGLETLVTLLYEVKGNLVTDKRFTIFCHQVNCMGKMGKGIAKEIAEAYPEVYMAYMDDYDKRVFGIGNNLYVKTHDNRVCVNMYGQHEYGKGLHTDYGALSSCFFKLAKKLNVSDEKLVIGFPRFLGCGNGGGDWEIVKGMIEDLSTKVKQDIYIVEVDND